MAGEGTDTIVNETLSGELGEPKIEDGVLPSEKTEVKTSEDWVTENTSENGKLFGQFDDMQSALEHYRKQEVTHTNNMRELKNEQKSKQEEVQSVQAELQEHQVQQETLTNLSTSLLEGNMVFTDEINLAIEEAGLSKADVELNAYKAREVMDAQYQVLGGKESYDAEMQYGSEIYDETQIEGIMGSIRNNSVTPEFRELALLGLRAKRLASEGGESITPDNQEVRITGRSTNIPSVTGYTDQNELFADRRASQKNPVMKAKYLAKLAITDDKVLSLH